MKIKITAGSGSDLPKELIEKHNISISPMPVYLGDKEYKDGVDIDMYKISDYVKNLKGREFPKTAAPSRAELEEFFTKEIAGYDALIHFEISEGISSTVNNAKAAAEEVKNVYVIDSKSLSTGVSLLVMKAVKLNNGKRTAEEIVREVEVCIPKVQCSFVLDRLDYMKKGGRCSGLMAFVATVLFIKPKIVMNKEGRMVVGKKYMGQLSGVLKKYTEEILTEHKDTADKSLAFITNTGVSEENFKYVEGKLKEFGFKQIVENKAGATIFSHCGENTLGVLFLTK